MWRKIWRNKLEFYPYLAILSFWLFGSFVQAFMLVNRPEVVALGLITILPVSLIVIAMVRTYKSLSEEGS